MSITYRNLRSARRTQLREGYVLGISVAEALQVGKLRRARVLAGHQGLGRMIEHVDVIEMPDIRPWVKPNILYLTSFYAIRDNPAAQQDLIRYLAGHGAAALVLA